MIEFRIQCPLEHQPSGLSEASYIPSSYPLDFLRLVPTTKDHDSSLVSAKIQQKTFLARTLHTRESARFPQIVRAQHRPTLCSVATIHNHFRSRHTQSAQKPPRYDQKETNVIGINLPNTAEGRSLQLEAKQIWETVHRNKNRALDPDVVGGKSSFEIGLSYEIRNDLGLQAMRNGIVFNPNHPFAKKLCKVDKTASKRVFELRLPAWTSWRNLSVGIGLLLLASTVVWYNNREQVPISGRWRFNFFSKDEGIWGAAAHEHEMRKWGSFIASPEHPISIQVKQVLEKLVPFTGLDQLEWEAHLVNAPGIINASVSAGGKVMVYSGILPICKDETGLATVLSHEIAHIVAGHLAEDASKRTVIGIASIPTWPTMILATFGIMFYGPFTLVALVWSGALGGAAMWSSRTRESEADFIGLVIMSRAGYDIRQAVKFWERMKNQTDADLAQKYGKGGKAAQEPELFSTHPHDQTRINHMKKVIPEILRTARKDFLID